MVEIKGGGVRPTGSEPYEPRENGVAAYPSRQASVRRAFNEEFKAVAVQRVLDGETLQAVADSLGVHVNVLRGWRNREVPEASATDTVERLHRENALLKVEIEYLRKREALLRWRGVR